MVQATAQKDDKVENTTCMKVIFLDVDGVCHPLKRDGCMFTPEPMAQLRRLVNATGASLVISSTWRQSPHLLRKLDEELARHGISAPVSRTPVFTPLIHFRRCADDADQALVRAREVCAWLQATDLAVTSCVALDDLDLGGGASAAPTFLRPWFVRADPDTGLSSSNVDTAIAVLEGGVASSAGAGSVRAASAAAGVAADVYDGPTPPKARPTSQPQGRPDPIVAPRSARVPPRLADDLESGVAAGLASAGPGEAAAAGDDAGDNDSSWGSAPSEDGAPISPVSSDVDSAVVLLGSQIAAESEPRFAV